MGVPKIFLSIIKKKLFECLMYEPGATCGVGIAADVPHKKKKELSKTF